jgi:hypothetical protein
LVYDGGLVQLHDAAFRQTSLKLGIVTEGVREKEEEEEGAGGENAKER